MNPIKWFRKRSAEKAVAGPLGDQGKFYYLMSYEEEYSELLPSVPDRNGALSELFLFRFWLTQCAYRLAKPEALSEDDILNSIIPNGMTLGNGMFQRINSVDIEEALGYELSELVELRFQMYDRDFISEKTASDPFALEAVSCSLAAQIFDDPSETAISYLAQKAQEQLDEIVSTWAGNPSRANKPASADRDLTASKSTSPSAAPDWLIVNEFGESKVFLDKSSVSKAGALATVNVLYDLKPSGKDQRNNKPVKQMIMREEYNLNQGKFRVHRIDFVYEDGTRSAPLMTNPEWKEASEGNAKTLAALHRLADI